MATIQFNPYLPSVEAADLTGTDKQVAWANAIRDEKIGGLIEALDWYRERNPELVAKKEAQYATLLAETDARFWINNRFEVGTTLLKKAVAK